jgi:hypothetical protein
MIFASIVPLLQRIEGRKFAAFKTRRVFGMAALVVCFVRYFERSGGVFAVEAFALWCALFFLFHVALFLG